MGKIKKVILLALLPVLLLVGCDDTTYVTDEYVMENGGTYKTPTDEKLNNTEIKNKETIDTKSTKEKIDNVKVDDKQILKEQKNKILSILELDIETEDVIRDVDIIEAKTHRLKGYVTSHKIDESLDNKYTKEANISIRIPKIDVDKFQLYINEHFNVVLETSSTLDVTESFYSLETRIKNLEAQEARLLELYNKTDNIDEMIKISSRLTDVSIEKDKSLVEFETIKEKLEMANINIKLKEREDLSTLGIKNRVDMAVNKILDVGRYILINITIGFIYLSPFILIVFLLTRNKKIMSKIKKPDEDINNDEDISKD